MEQISARRQLQTGFATVAAFTLAGGFYMFAGDANSAGALVIGPGQLNRAAISVNRDAKSDRISAPSVKSGQPTITFQLQGLPATSIAMKSLIQESRTAPKRVERLIDENRPGKRHAIACEPAVSVLTEVAKLLAPGRCIT